MDFGGMIGGKYGLRLRKGAASPDNDIAHVSSKIAVWKASMNR